MSPRSRVFVALYFVGLSGFALIAALVKFVDNVFALLIFLLAISLQVYISRVRCPGCKKPVCWNPIRMFGFELIWWWTPFSPKHCSGCGADLRVMRQ